MTENEKEAKVDEVAEELKTVEQDDIEIQASEIEGDTVIVVKLNRRTDPPTENRPNKYSRILSKMLSRNSYVIVKGNGNNAGLALTCAKMLRIDMAELGIKTTWSYVGKKPKMLIREFERDDKSIGKAQIPVLRIKVSKSKQ